MDKKMISWLGGVAGAVLIGVGFYAQARTNAENAAGSYMGRAAEGSAVPWVLGILGALLIVAAAWAALQANRPANATAIPMGWHDDPEDPSRLRYHDGRDWTERTAEKSK